MNRRLICVVAVLSFCLFSNAPLYADTTGEAILNDNVRFLIDNDATDYDSSAGASDNNKVLVQAEVKF